MKLFFWATIAVSTLCLISTSSAEEIYSCNGIFKNTPCTQGEKGAAVSLPRLGRFEAEAARGSLNPANIPENGIRGTREGSRVAPRAIRADEEIMALHLDVTRLNEEFDSFQRERGNTELQNSITNYQRRAQGQCSQIQEGSESKELCKDLFTQLQRMQEKVPPT